ncbi:hypothetical protein DH2020_006535 [Rehmannia glutinosa]|uniref:Tf2-1-like SH3-like domain-containing protein n=1 Tax=Rehmannia glutinosa TaxID=99300 RepID=A0ABR0XJ99_REHGL
MLRACTLDFQGSWDSDVPLAEFAYNNSYQATIGMAPYEALYLRKCRSPLYWEIDDQWTPKEKQKSPSIPKVNLVQEAMEKVKSCQKSYADKRRKDLEFEAGDEVSLRLSPRGKLAYRLELPAQYAGMHNVFHVSRLKKYQPDPEHIITQDTPPLMENLSYIEKPIRIIDQQIRQLRNREIPMVKVVWRNHNRDEDATWEMEEDMRNQYPELF